MDRPSFLARFLDVPSDRPALRFDRWYTYGELRERGERVAGWLAERGVGPGDRVLIQLDNGPDLVSLHLGCMALGVVRVPVNAHYRDAEVGPILEDVQPRLVVTREPGLFSGWPLATEVGAGRRVDLWAEPPGDVTCWLFTSGTTGRSKGVPQTFAMWERNLDALVERWSLGAEDRLWLALPLFHTHGLVLGLHGTLLRGASAVILPRFEPVPPAADCTHVYGVPTWYRRWLSQMQAQPGAFAHLRALMSGSDGMEASLWHAIRAATGHAVVERYGMTETVMLCANPVDGERRPGTVGPPLPGVEVRIVAGEVQVRGGSVFGGYFPRPDPTAFTGDGWFRTGDAGEWDEAGYLRLVGRQKELVIVGGVNVAPAEVEKLLETVPGVAEAGVCGIPDPDLGEVVAAAVVPDGTVPTDRLRAALDAAARAHLSGLKRPRAWAFVDRLPRNALGKLQRGRLRAEAGFGP